MSESFECEKHKGNQRTQLCETCKTALCLDCKAEHDPKHVIYHLQELGQKLILQLSKDDDIILYQELCKLSDDLEAEVVKLKSWFETTEKKVVEVVHQCMSDVMNEVLAQTHVKLNKKKKKMEEILKLSSTEREKIQEDIKAMIMDEKYAEIYKQKDLYFQCLAKRKLFVSAASSKPTWIEHVKQVKNLTEDFLKETLSNSLKKMFTVPISYIIPQKSNSLIVYNVTTKKRTTYKLQGIVKSKHFDSVMIKNIIYIAGGLDEENKQKPLLKNTYQYELLNTENVLTRNSDLLVARYAHKMIEISGQIIYALGGIVGSFYGTKYSNHCEKYDRAFDRWVESAPLYESKGYMNACSFIDRYIYVFGGFIDDALTVSSPIVEFLDTMIERDGWKLVKFEDTNKKWIPFSQGCAVQLNRNLLLLFGGRTTRTQCSADTFIYEIKDSVIKLLDCKLTQPTAFYQRSAVFYNDDLYAFDANENDLHIFNPSQVKWNVIKRAEWDVNDPK